MYRMSFLVAAALLVGAGATRPVNAQGIDGNWKFSYVVNGNIEQTLAIVGLKADGGKATGEIVAARLANPTFKSVTQKGNLLRVIIQGSGVELTFEGILPKQGAKQIAGSVAIDGTMYLGALVQTDDTTLDAKTSSRLLPCPPFQQARTLAAKAAKLRQSALQAKDPDKKADLLKQYAEADAAAKKEAPKLYQEVLAQHADSPVVFDAGLNLIRAAKANAAGADDVKGWASTLTNSAKAFGPRWQGEMTSQIASALVGQDGHGPLALEYARMAEKALAPNASATEQVRVLNVVSKALHKNGKNDEAVALDARVAKLEDILDREYSAKMPGFKGEAFTGRKGKSERAVFMELFTGATCPPCVAADLAFDVLEKTYKPSELVLIQYHMHIPGPDPLTNPDTEARWAYYRSAYPKQVGGVPSSLFNGTPKAGSGGPAAFAEKKYEAYREVINPLLEEDTLIKLTAKAERVGDKIDIHVKVTGVSDPGTDKKLRILVAEETVRYPGSNKIRLHHNVVRAFPGGVKGIALTEAASKHNASVSVPDLRTNLTKYLDDYEANFRPFANPARPLAMSHLRVIAFVQDDSSHEILQVVQVEVQEK